MKYIRSLFPVHLLLCGAAFAVTQLSSAPGYDYVDDAVPNIMDADGSPEQRVDYLLGEADSYVRATPEAIIVGSAHSYNELHVTNSAIVTPKELIIGNQESSGYNQAAINYDAIWTNTEGTTVGLSGSGNTLLILHGAQLNDRVSIIGKNVGANDNQVLVGLGGVWRNVEGLAIGESGSNNLMRISGGSSVETSQVSYIGANSTSHNNEVEVTGVNSIWTTDSLQVGHPDSDNNILRIYDGGLVIVEDVLNVGDGTSELNYIWLYNGYLAWKGDRYEDMVDLLIDCKIQTVDVEGAWFEFYYIESEEESLDFTNGLYGGLTGYTVATAVPEPATYALIAVGLLALVHLRNRSRNR